MKATALAGLITAATLVGAPTTARTADLGIHVRLGGRHGGGIELAFRSHGEHRGYYAPAPRYRGRTAARVGYDRGYSEGLREGIEDARRHHRFEFWRDKTYRHADRGYHSEYGPRFVYSKAFREGYEAGYRRGYARPEPRGYYGRRPY